jgi:hypothetical protein
MNFPTKVGEAIYTFKIPPGKRRKATKVLTPHKKKEKQKRRDMRKLYVYLMKHESGFTLDF